MLCLLLNGFLTLGRAIILARLYVMATSAGLASFPGLRQMKLDRPALGQLVSNLLVPARWANSQADGRGLHLCCRKAPGATKEESGLNRASRGTPWFFYCLPGPANSRASTGHLVLLSALF